jgi:hypothetical protein
MTRLLVSDTSSGGSASLAGAGKGGGHAGGEDVDGAQAGEY